MEKLQYSDETIREYVRYQNSSLNQRLIRWYQDDFQNTPTRRNEAEAAVNLLYERAGHPPPSRFVWFLSPFDLVSKLRFETKCKINDDISCSWEEVAVALLAESENSSDVSTVISIHPNNTTATTGYGEFIGRASLSWMRDPDNNDVPLVNQLELFWGYEIREAVGDSIEHIKHPMATHWADKFLFFWIQFIFSPNWIHTALSYEYLAEFFSMPELLQTVEPIRRVLKTCDWIIATEEVCFLSEKHIIAHHDKTGKLHSDSGLALEYADGWGIYAHHGIRIPSQEYHELERQKKLGLKGQEKLW